MPTLLQEEWVARQRPLNIKEQHEHLFSHEFARFFPAVQAVRVAVAFVDGPILLPILGRLDEHLVHTNKAQQIGRCANILLRGGRNRIVRGNYFWIANSWSYGYFHWICDVLPKLELLSSILTPASVIAPALERILPAAAASTGAFGVPVEHHAEHGILFNIRYLPDICPTGNMRPHLMRRIRCRFAKRRTRSERRLYATRGAFVRGIENEREMMAGLSTLGFEMIEWSGLTFAEQVQLASEAAVLIGPHGANLTNCLFMPEGALLIELRALGDAHNNCYYALADSVGVRYGYSLHPLTANGRFWVDLPVLMHDVARLLDLSRQVGA
jgi:hypothetical protein